MKKNINKNTLSFSCSKSMKYLRTPIDIWERLKKEFDFTIDICASDENHLLPRYYTIEDNALTKQQKAKEHLFFYYQHQHILNIFTKIFIKKKM